jgi:hypothetical protein
MIFDLEERYRKIQTLIKVKKRENAANNSTQDGKVVDPDDALTEQELQEQITMMEELKAEEERSMRKVISEMDKKISAMSEDKDLNDVRLRDKEQELKIADLKLRELKRNKQNINIA